MWSLITSLHKDSQLHASADEPHAIKGAHFMWSQGLHVPDDFQTEMHLKEYFILL